jgi:hypothetical protein
MKFTEAPTSPSANKATSISIPMPYSRLILNVVCLAICGWILLETSTASATVLAWGMA